MLTYICVDRKRTVTEAEREMNKSEHRRDVRQSKWVWVQSRVAPRVVGLLPCYLWGKYAFLSHNMCGMNRKFCVMYCYRLEITFYHVYWPERFRNCTCEIAPFAHCTRGTLSSEQGKHFVACLHRVLLASLCCRAWGPLVFLLPN